MLVCDECGKEIKDKVYVVQLDGVCEPNDSENDPKYHVECLKDKDYQRIDFTILLNEGVK